MCGETGLTRRAALTLVSSLFDEMAARLAAGEEVEIYGFGNFGLCDKARRKSRNPRTLEAVPVASRRAVVFRASRVLKGGAGAAGVLLRALAEM